MANKIKFPNVFGRWIPLSLFIVIMGMAAFWLLGNALFGMPTAYERAKVGSQTEDTQGGIVEKLGSDLVAAIGAFDVVEWIRYEDEDYGFTVDYPASWSYKVFDYDNQRIICMYNLEEGEDCLAIISVDINADQDEIYGEVKELFVEDNYVVVEKVMNIGGLGEVQMMEVEDSEDFSKFAFFTKGDNVYGAQTVAAAEAMFDAMLSSIKFGDEE